MFFTIPPFLPSILLLSLSPWESRNWTRDVGPEPANHKIVGAADAPYDFELRMPTAPTLISAQSTRWDRYEF